ncbi:MAG TPA: nicotinate-nucleotide--dimethylbenzimidazole phosphoribosyltransferase, partial [Paracoccus sp.]|nr:nicotinate-nucleotide--dimethylbenzimidazole phosphoribosyltransferase [Paracoccus sp. (in: a-proteobacteria)]
MTSFDETAAKAARDRQNSLTKPPGSLGRLEDLAVFMAGWQGRARPRLERAQALVFAGNHGVVAQNVNPFPAEVTALMVANFSAGGAAINQLCRVAGADLSVVTLELDRPTADFTQNVAMTSDEVRAAMQAGADAVDSQADVLLLGEMGIGNSTVAAVLAAWTFGGRAEDWVGPGTGAEGEILANKLRAVTAGLARHDPMTAADALAAFGGREQAALCGAILRAREL